jgi:hypothetical protein
VLTVRVTKGGAESSNHEWTHLTRLPHARMVKPVLQSMSGRTASRSPELRRADRLRCPHDQTTGGRVGYFLEQITRRTDITPRYKDITVPSTQCLVPPRHPPLLHRPHSATERRRHPHDHHAVACMKIHHAQAPHFGASAHQPRSPRTPEHHRHLRCWRTGRGVSVRDDAARYECVLGGLRISGRHHAGTTAGGQGMAGFAISHSCPNGSSTRPTRQPCSRPTADFSEAPASTALA